MSESLTNQQIVEQARVWHGALKDHTGPTWTARRECIGALLQMIDDLRKTNRRLNRRCQKAESTAAVFTRAVDKWVMRTEDGATRRTVIPLRTLTTIAAAAGKEFDAEFYEDHAQRMSRLESERAHYQGGQTFWREADRKSEARIKELQTQVEDLEKSADKLCALEAHGVDSWEGYSEAMRSLD